MSSTAILLLLADFVVPTLPEATVVGSTIAEHVSLQSGAASIAAADGVVPVTA